jgi:hypothetical protein
MTLRTGSPIASSATWTEDAKRPGARSTTWLVGRPDWLTTDFRRQRFRAARASKALPMGKHPPPAHIKNLCGRSRRGAHPVGSVCYKPPSQLSSETPKGAPASERTA